MAHVTTITATQMHQKRGEVLKRCFRDKEHFVVERDGMPLIAIIPIEQYRAAFPDKHDSSSSQT